MEAGPAVYRALRNNVEKLCEQLDELENRQEVLLASIGTHRGFLSEADLVAQALGGRSGDGCQVAERPRSSLAAVRATMRKLRKNQCIVVSGESGAGKTETNRQLLNYLVWRGTDAQSQDQLTQKILDTNPILESFGNAKTTRNKNSSRFGRYVLVRFSADYQVGEGAPAAPDG